MKKYIYISNMAAPYQVKFCKALNKFFNAEFWFYEYIDKTRPNWWKIPLGNKCKVIKDSILLPKIGYVSFNVITKLIKCKPDIVVLGGFYWWHALILLIAKKTGAKVAVMSEPFRAVKADEIMKNNQTGRIYFFRLKIIKLLFKKADLFIGMGELAKNQFEELFGVSGDRVVNLSYPQDIEEYYSHPLRDKNYGEPIRLLFANRLVERYKPLLMLEVLKELNKEYKHIELAMNAEGNLKNECQKFIHDNKITNVTFLEDIDNWNNMHKVYKESDILVLPCVYSNGNGTIIEARASGMGVVISNRINNIERHSIDGENCYICNLNKTEFVRAISKYINNPEKLTKHGKLSKKLVQYRLNNSTAKKYYRAFCDKGLI